MNITFFVVLWVVLGVATLALALYRKVLSNQENDVLALAAGEEGKIPGQVDLARKLETIDRWGKTITVLTAVVGLALACTYLYQAWLDPSAVPNNFYRRNP
jgi:hypothetical protein